MSSIPRETDTGTPPDADSITRIEALASKLERIRLEDPAAFAMYATIVDLFEAAVAEGWVDLTRGGVVVEAQTAGGLEAVIALLEQLRADHLEGATDGR